MSMKIKAFMGLGLILVFFICGGPSCIPEGDKSGTGPVQDGGGGYTGGGNTGGGYTGGGYTGGGYYPPPTGGNGIPWVNIEPFKNPVFFNERVTFIAKAGDPNNDPLSYDWSASGVGSFDNPHASTVNWMAPNFERMVNIEVIVRDNKGGESRTSVMINVIPSGGSTRPNSPPMFSGEPYIMYPNGNYYAKAGDKVGLGAYAYDPDGDPITYNWRSNMAAGIFSNPGPNSATCDWTLPPDPYATGYELICEVRDSKGAMSDRRIWITVQPSGSSTYNSPPQITDVHSDMNTIGSGGKVRVFASAYDPEGDPISYNWHSASGIGFFSNPGPNAPECDWYSSGVPAGSYELICDVTDSKGLMSQRSVWIAVWTYMP